MSSTAAYDTYDGVECVCPVDTPRTAREGPLVLDRNEPWTKRDVVPVVYSRSRLPTANGKLNLEYLQ
jgi:hypothetical protein